MFETIKSSLRDNLGPIVGGILAAVLSAVFGGPLVCAAGTVIAGLVWGAAAKSLGTAGTFPTAQAAYIASPGVLTYGASLALQALGFGA